MKDMKLPDYNRPDWFAELENRRGADAEVSQGRELDGDATRDLRDTTHGRLIRDADKPAAVWFLITGLLEQVRQKVPDQTPVIMAQLDLVNGTACIGAVTTCGIRGIVKIGQPAMDEQRRPIPNVIAEQHVHVADIVKVTLLRQVETSPIVTPGRIHPGP